MTKHSSLASNFQKQIKQASWHDKTLWKVRKLRDNVASEVEDFEALREAASKIKTYTLAHLSEHLETFEKNAKKNNVVVHWAKDANEHNQIIYELLKEKKITEVIKSKSMLTEECGLNPYLKSRNIEVIDSDLGELIVQLRKEPPSHIVMPAIHLNRQQVGDIFLEKKLIKKYSNDPTFLTGKAREYLREKFLNIRAGITGVNFGIAETGGVVVVTNEGNADLGVNLADVHIHSMGIEKIIPHFADLGVFIRLLARSATGQPISVYTSHYCRPTKVAKEMHIVIVDNGRSKRLASEKFYQGLKCIRCGACMNTCPVYRSSGGYSYHYPIPGPIGSVIAPFADLKKNRDLPFASSLCGSCTYVCPVKINLHEQLFDWRQEIAKSSHRIVSKKIAAFFLKKFLTNGKLTDWGFSFLRFFLKITPAFILQKNGWGKYREFPAVPQETFKTWYKKNQENE